MTMVILERKSGELKARRLAGFAARARRAVGLQGEVNVLVAGGVRLRRLNRRFRRRDAPTDVLSFAAAKPPAEGGHTTRAQPLAGDLAICLDLARAQARRLGHSLEQEVKVLILHGMLHLKGYDHQSDNGRMARREEKLRRRLHLPPALIARSRPAARGRKGRL